jgi:hypothetical protein
MPRMGARTAMARTNLSVGDIFWSGLDGDVEAGFGVVVNNAMGLEVGEGNIVGLSLGGEPI